MLKIEVEMSALSSEQREAVAGFIMTFPSAAADNQIIEQVETAPESETEIDPSAVFGEATPIPSAPVVSSNGPHLVIPPPVASPNVSSVTAPPSGGATLDKAGLPWDDRIHAGSKTVTADGLWRKKRGVDDATISAVETELRALMSIPAPTPVAAVPPPPPAPVVEAAPVPAAVEVDPRQTFVALVGRASTLIQSGKLTQAELQAICNSVGVPSLPMLANRLDLVPSVNQLIDSTLASK